MLKLVTFESLIDTSNVFLILDSTNFGRAGSTGFFSGPTISDLGTGVANIRQAARGKPRGLARQALRAIPAAGGFLANTLVPSSRRTTNQIKLLFRLIPLLLCLPTSVLASSYTDFTGELKDSKDIGKLNEQFKGLYTGKLDIGPIHYANNKKVGINTSDPKALLHVKTAPSGGSVGTDGDEFIIENNGFVGMTLLSGNADEANINFGDSDDGNVGNIKYNHGTDNLGFVTGASFALELTGTNRLHVFPVGTIDVEFEVSDGVTQGAGTIHASTIATHSSRDIKNDIVYHETGKFTQGYGDVYNLRPASFRYNRFNPVTGKQDIEDRSIPLTTGLIFEDSPASIQTEHGAISLNARILNLEMAVKRLIDLVDPSPPSRAQGQGPENAGK